MLATGALWLIGSAVEPVALAHRGPLIQLLVCHPRGRPRGRAERLAIIFGYVDSLDAVGHLAPATLALSGYVVAVVIIGYRRTRGPERRAKLTSSAASLAVFSVLATGAVAGLADWQIEPQVLACYDIVLIATAVLVAVDVRWGRWDAAAVTRLVIDLGQGTGRSLRSRLADALGDPSLVMGFPTPARDVVVDDGGRPVDLTPAPGRTVTPILDGERQLAFLIHDPAAVSDPQLLVSVTALARVALTNVRLRAEVQAHLVEVAASRRRLLDVEDAERARLGDELRAGPQLRLDHIAALLRDGTTAEVARQVGAARQSVRDFAHGIHPRLLSECGLSAALGELASGATLPVDLDLAAGRWPETVELTTSFVCAEALTNIAKYASASRASVRTTASDEHLVVEIRDDGIGGADDAGGSGLRGLADRVEALGGQLRISSPLGTGTTISAVIPCVS